MNKKKQLQRGEAGNREQNPTAEHQIGKGLL